MPPAWHLMLFQPDHDLVTLGPDGAERGGFYPPARVGPMERMWAGGVMKWERNQLRVGQKVCAVQVCGRAMLTPVQVACETRLKHAPELKRGKRGE